MKNKELSDVISITALSRDNAAFELRDGFLYMTHMGNESRVSLQRAFPFETEREYISVLDPDKKEIGMIRSLDKDFDEKDIALLSQELDRKYFSPVITKINDMKDNYGFMQVNVETDLGEISFGVRDIYRSILKVGGGRVFIVDVDGNRYEIPSVDALDRHSRRKLELYL